MFREILRRSSPARGPHDAGGPDLRRPLHQTIPALPLLGQPLLLPTAALPSRQRPGPAPRRHTCRAAVGQDGPTGSCRMVLCTALCSRQSPLLRFLTRRRHRYSNPRKLPRRNHHESTSRGATDPLGQPGNPVELETTTWCSATSRLARRAPHLDSCTRQYRMSRGMS